MKAESIAECSPWSILQYFWPALSDKWSWKLILVVLRVAILDRFYYIVANSNFSTLRHFSLVVKGFYAAEGSWLYVQQTTFPMSFWRESVTSALEWG